MIEGSSHFIRAKMGDSSQRKVDMRSWWCTLTWRRSAEPDRSATRLKNILHDVLKYV